MATVDLSDTAVKQLLELAKKVGAADRKKAFAWVSVLIPEMAAAVLQELLDTRAQLREAQAKLGQKK